MFTGRDIREKRKREGLTVEALAERLSVSKENLYKWEKGTKITDPQSFLKLQEWLENVPRSTFEEPARSYRQKLKEIKNGAKPPVPVFGGFTTLGNIQVYDDGNLKNKIVGYLPTEFFPNCDYAEKAKGDSMYPLIMNQALLVGKTCPVNGISYGEKYIIKTKEGLDTTKFVHPGSEAGKIKLKAYNKSIPEQEIEISEIVFVCRIHWIVNPT
jgi:transcriptional regulator with XRE-family HTH domain